MKVLTRTSVLVVVSAATAAWTAEAQQTASQGGPNTRLTHRDTVIVTARRREESLQDVPVSAAVIEAAQIEDLALAQPRDLIAQVPGVAMAAGTVGAVVSDEIVIRGVGTARLESSGAATGIFRGNMFIGNGTYFGRTFTQFDMFDIKRFEVFKGPQGALWGRQAAGGAVSIVTQEPEFNFGARLKAGYEFEQQGTKVEGMVNQPLADNFAIRVGGLYDDKKGGLITINDPTSPLNGEALDKSRMAGARAAARWAPNANFDQSLTVEYMETDQPSYAVFFSRPGRGDPSIYERACTTQLPTSRFLPGQFCKFNDSDQQSHTDMWQAFYQGQLNLGPGDLQISATYTDRHTDVDDEWDTYTHALVGPTVGISTTGAVLTSPAIRARGVGPTNTSLYTRYGDFEKSGAELLYMAAPMGPLSWLAGVDYYQTDDVANQKNIIQYRNPAGALGPLPNGALIANHLLDNTNSREGDSWSVFAALNYELSQTFSFSLDGRYTDNKITHTANNLTLLTCSAEAVRPINCVTPGQLLVRAQGVLDGVETEEEIFTPVATLTAKVLPGHTAYLRYAEGFRPAGYDTRNSLGVFFGSYDAERVRSLELGYKGTVFGNILYNVDGYYNDHKDFQIQDTFVGDDGFIRNKIGNAPEAESWGVEAQGRGRWDIGPGGMSLGVAWAYTDGVIKPYEVPQANPAVRELSPLSSKRLPDTRDYQIVLGVGYEAPLGFSDATWSLNASYRREGGGWQNPQNTLPLSDFELADAIFAVKMSDWRVGAYVKNLTDETYVVQNIPGVFPEGAVSIYNLPRTFGVEATMTF